MRPADEPAKIERFTEMSDNDVAHASAVVNMSGRVVQALQPLSFQVQLSVACTVLMQVLVAIEVAARENPPETNEEREGLASLRAAIADAVSRIGLCVEAMQQADTTQDLEQAVRLFEDHPGGGGRAN